MLDIFTYNCKQVVYWTANNFSLITSSSYDKPLACVIPLSYAYGAHADYSIAISI